MYPVGNNVHKLDLGWDFAIVLGRWREIGWGEI
jgi:hypothetical protein